MDSIREQKVAIEGKAAQKTASDQKPLDPIALAQAELDHARSELEAMQSPSQLAKMLEKTGLSTKQAEAIIASASALYDSQQRIVTMAETKLELARLAKTAYDALAKQLAGTDCTVIITAGDFRVVHGRTVEVRKATQKTGRGRGRSRGGWIVGDQVFTTGKALCQVYKPRENELKTWLDHKTGETKIDWSGTARNVQNRLRKEMPGVKIGREADFSQQNGNGPQKTGD